MSHLKNLSFFQIDTKQFAQNLQQQQILEGVKQQHIEQLEQQHREAQQLDQQLQQLNTQQLAIISRQLLNRSSIVVS